MCGSAQATLIFTLGNNPQPDEQNILLNKGTSGTTVFGQTNISNTTVNFSSTEVLTEPSSGQARIQAQDGLINNVTITVPGFTFKDFILNPLCAPGSGGCGNAIVTGVTNDGTTPPFTYALGNGNNFLTITTGSGETISSLTLTAATGFQDLRQPRVSSLSPVGVPEPTTMLLLGAGLIGLTAYSRKKLC